MKRDTASTIFRTVVFAGAMLGTSACAKKPATNTPMKTPSASPATDPAMMKGEAAKKPAAAEDESDPCAGGENRPRGTSDEGGETGRGFILS
jgi:hypothetical protein